VGRPSSQASQMSPPQAAASPAATPGGKVPPARQSVPANQRSSPSTRPPTSSQNSAESTAVSQDVRITSSTNTDGPVCQILLFPPSILPGGVVLVTVRAQV